MKKAPSLVVAGVSAMLLAAVAPAGAAEILSGQAKAPNNEIKQPLTGKPGDRYTAFALRAPLVNAMAETVARTLENFEARRF